MLRICIKLLASLLRQDAYTHVKSLLFLGEGCEHFNQDVDCLVGATNRALD
jgi:hypothetical protein